MKLIDPLAIAVATIWQEARGESHEGRVAVAEVIRNRMTSKYQSDGTIVGTCLKPYQFSGWNTKDPNRIPALNLDDDDPIVADCVEAWDEAMAGSDLVQGADHYLNPKVVAALPDWYDPAKVTIQIGHHTFLKLR